MRNCRIIAVAAFVALGMIFSSVAYAGGLPKPVSKVPEAQKLIDQAWALYKNEATIEAFRQCITLLEQADKLDPNNASILFELSRYYFSYGDMLPKQTKEQQKLLQGLYEKGMEAAKKSLSIKETVSGHYWFAVNKAASLEFSSIVAQAAAFPAIYKHSEYVGDNDPDFYYGGNGRLWSEILSRVPKKAVELVGWDVNDAVEEIDRSIKAEPRFFDNYLYKARFVYVYFGNNDEALKLLDVILKQDPNVFPEEVTANRCSQQVSRQLWKKITGKDFPNR